MPLRSQNGYSANDRSVIGSYQLPGGRVALRAGDVSVVLLWCANRWHETVEPLVWPGIWGYAERTIRGSSTTLSNHASGTAIDCNAPRHPLGTDPRANFTALQIRAVDAILEYGEGTIRWGGYYSGRKDGMHLEVVGTAAQLKRVADKIRNIQSRPPVVVPVAPPTPPPLSREDSMLIRSQPDKGKPDVVTGLLTGFNFVALGRTETPTDEQAAKMGLPVIWVEYGTWQEFDRRSHVMLGDLKPATSPNSPSPST